MSGEPRVLIVYGSTEGQTAKIARVLADMLGRREIKAEVFAAGNLAPTGAALTPYDAIVVGSAVHIGRFHKSVRDWVRRNNAELEAKPSAFFSVCLGVLEASLETQQAERKIVEDFLKKSNWRPPIDAIFAGAIKYTRYGWLKKLALKRIAARAGSTDSDTSRDYEYTDWAQVEAFAGRIAAAVLAARAHGPRAGLVR